MIPWLLPAVCEFEVRANEIKSVQATFARAGRVRLRFTDLPGSAPSIPASTKDKDRLGRSIDALLSPLTPHRVRVFYGRHPHGEKQPLHHLVIGTRGWTSEYYLPDARAVGNELLAPDRYRLTFEVDGAAIDPCWIDVAHGFVTDVDRTLKER